MCPRPIVGETEWVGSPLAYPDPELELKASPNQQTAELIFVCSNFSVVIFPDARGNFMHNFRSMPA